MIVLLILLINTCEANKHITIGGFINSSVFLSTADDRSNLTFESRPKFVNITSGNKSYFVETVSIRKYLDCSTNSLEPKNFFLSSPIPDLQVNQQVSFYCSLRYFAARSNSIGKPKIGLYSSSINVSNVSQKESERFLVLNFNYTVPDNEQEAYKHDQETFTCSAKNKYFFTPNSEIDLEKEESEITKIINQCVFYLNISYKPFIDRTVPTKIFDIGENKLNIECPIRASRKSKIQWIHLNRFLIKFNKNK